MSRIPPDRPFTAPKSGRSAKVAQIRDLIGSKQFSAALQLLEPMLRLDPRDQELLSLAARTNAELGRLDQAMALCTRALTVAQHPEPLMLRGDVLRAMGRTDEALADFRRAAQLAPDRLELPLAVAATLEEAGQIEEARKTLSAVVAGYKSRNQPLPPKCVFEQAKLMVHDGEYAQAIAAIDAVHVAKEAIGTVPHRVLLFLRAKACDRAGDYAGAWESAQRAHAAFRRDFDPASLTRETDALIAYWTRERIRALPDSGVRDPTPVFIAGMPRSGTSLVDQIIHAHPRGAGVGELDALETFAATADTLLMGAANSGSRADIDEHQYAKVAEEYLRRVRSLAPNAGRIVNKALGNGRILGHLARLFPATRVVHVVRDPRDVAVSCVTGAFNSARTPWIAQPDWVAHAWQESERLMAHWTQVLDTPILRVRYEDLVRRGPDEFRRIIEFVGLPWDDAVTRFHESRRTVRTLSYDQVNRPLYSSSVGRWKLYEAQLSGVNWPAY